MSETLDQRFSRQLFELTKGSWVLRHAAAFAASDLIWLMMGGYLGMMYWEFTRPDLGFGRQITVFLSALLIPYAVTFLIGRLVKRPRPYQREHYRPILMPFIETPSFPSSHATFVFALVALVHTFLPELFVPFLVGAIIVAVARVAIGVHYVSDILMGAAIGFLFGKAAQIAILLGLTLI